MKTLFKIALCMAYLLTGQLILSAQTFPLSIPERPEVGNMMVAAGSGCSLGLKTDGTVLAIGWIWS